MKHCKNVLSLCICLTALAALLLCLPTKAEATVVDSGTCGDNLTWTLDDTGTLTISGTGFTDIWFSVDSIPWYAVCDDIKTVVMEEGIIAINTDMFSACDNLISVTIPASVIEIGPNAFGDSADMIGLWVHKDNKYFTNDNAGVLFDKGKTMIIKAPGGISGSYIIPDSVTTIEDRAFANCDRLTSVSIPDSVISIGLWAFSDCDSLQYTVYENGRYLGNAKNPYLVLVEGTNYSVSSYIIHRDTKIIASTAFYDFINLTDVVIPEGVTIIGEMSFAYCFGLDNVTIPNSVTTIEDDAFLCCFSLTAVTIPDSLTYIGAGVFDSCDSLNYTIYDNGKYLGNAENPHLVLIESINKQITSCAIHKDTKVLGSSAFRGCNILTDIIIPDCVTTIGEAAFYDCSKLVKISVGENVTTIGHLAFNFCTDLTAVTFHNNLTTIARSAFSSCTGLTDVYYSGTVEQWSEIFIGSDNEYLTSATIHYRHIHEYTMNITATCTEDGYLEYICVHGEIYREPYAALGHDIIGAPAVTPTCTMPGFTAGSKCVRCDYTTQEVIAVLGHSFVNDICVACGAMKRVPGDLDDNEGVTTDDVVALLLYISMPDMFELPAEANADFTGDGTVTTDDAVKLLLHISMPDMFPL